MNETVSVLTSVEDHDFDVLNGAVRAHFAQAVAECGPSLFTVDAGDLYAAYIDNLPEGQRQHHRCSCCKNFIERYGNLATIGEDGALRSAMWPSGSVPEPYSASVYAMAKAVHRGTVTGVFLASEKVWGTAAAGGWTHFNVDPWASMMVPRVRAGLTPGQRMAAKREDFRTLSHGLGEYGRDAVAQALTLLEADALYRPEKVIGPARFLLALHDAVAGKPKPVRERLFWRAVASAPVGFCTPRSSMIGTLLDDIVAGMDFESVKRRFAAKMHPLQYQRPQAAPSAGNIAQAEKLIADMGLEPALHRRFARLDEVQTVWKPAVDAAPKAEGGVFAHLKPKGAATPAAPLDMPAQPITWDKFARTVLPTARKIEVEMRGRMALAGVLTAENADAPPLLQWDREDNRNPFSWYLYHSGSSAEDWSLRSGSWVGATGIMLAPYMWAGEEAHAHQGKFALIVLDGARDRREPELCLFPETLRSELHPIRSTIESYSHSRKATGAEEGSCNGLIVGRGSDQPRIRVTSAIGTACYRIDRWD